jgi:hypothetical protein
MSCCGRKRAATARTAPPRPEARPATALRHVVLQYLGSARVTYIGAATKRLYAFRATGASVAVDARDAGGLIALGLFRWVG